MRSLCVLSLAAGLPFLALAQSSRATGAAVTTSLPVIDGQRVVAVVNDEPIPLELLEREIAMLHMTADADAVAPVRENPAGLLDRLINAKLIAQEARASGLDETPEVAAQLERFEDETLRDALVRRRVASVKGDPAVAEQTYKDLTRTYRIRYFLLESEAEATSFFDALARGGSWDAEVKKREAVAVSLDGTTLKSYRLDEFLPEIRAMVTSLKPGEVHRPTQLRDGWVVLQVTAIEYPEDSEARARAEAIATETKQKEVTREYIDSLRAKYAVIDKKLLESVDFEKPGGLESAKVDTRQLVQIKGGTPVTVADLYRGMEERFFHGIDKAAKAGRLNKEKDAVLENLINKEVIVDEARRLGLDKTAEFAFALQRREDALLFDAYVRKAIAPNVKVEEADYRSYYAKHKEEFRTPAMMRLEALAFAKRDDAEAALDKLRRGSEFRWVEENAPGRLPPGDAGVTQFPTGMVVVATLPAGVQKALAGAGAGDSRFYEEADTKRYYVLRVVEQVPAGSRPYEDVRGEIAKSVAAEKFQEDLDALAAQLRAASDIKVYATKEELKRIVREDMASRN